jgi:hypothetical protein
MPEEPAHVAHGHPGCDEEDVAVVLDQIRCRASPRPARARRGTGWPRARRPEMSRAVREPVRGAGSVNLASVLRVDRQLPSLIQSRGDRSLAVRAWTYPREFGYCLRTDAEAPVQSARSFDHAPGQYEHDQNEHHPQDEQVIVSDT